MTNKTDKQNFLSVHGEMNGPKWVLIKMTLVVNAMIFISEIELERGQHYISTHSRP